MTIEEKIARYREIPKLIEDLQIDKEICTSVKSVQYDSIGEAKGTHENSTEKKLIDAAEIAAEIVQLERERDQLKLGILQEINCAISGDGAKEVEMRIILKSHLLTGNSLKHISCAVIHRDYGTTRKIFHEGLDLLKKPHSISLDLTCSNSHSML